MGLMFSGSLLIAVLSRSLQGCHRLRSSGPGYWSSTYVESTREGVRSYTEGGCPTLGGPEVAGFGTPVLQITRGRCPGEQRPTLSSAGHFKVFHSLLCGVNVRLVNPWQSQHRMIGPPANRRWGRPAPPPASWHPEGMTRA